MVVREAEDVSGCMLEIAGTTVVQSEGGPLEAEYALFDASEIELRATEYGAIHEVGYRTTVADALARLDASGATSAVIRDLVTAVHAVAAQYVPARARSLLGVLSASELLTGETFDVERHVYVSPVLDLASIVAGTGIKGAAAAFQAAGIAARLREARPDDEVMLRTASYMAPRRPGERSIRRVSLSAIRSLPAAVSKLRDRKPASSLEVTKSDLVAWLHRRGMTPARLAWAELVLEAGRLAARGPLSDPRALAIDVLIGASRVPEAVPLIDRLEVETGKSIAVQYLRLRAAFAQKTESAFAIAERASALALREPSPEAKLLAARAWSEAGQVARAATLANEVLAERDASLAMRDEARSLVEVKAEVEVVEEPKRPPSLTPQPALMRPSAPNLVLDLPPRPPAPSIAELTGVPSPLSQRPTPPPPSNPSSGAASNRPFIMGLSTPPQRFAIQPPTTSRAPTPKAPPVVQPSAMPTLPPPQAMMPDEIMQREREFSAPPVIDTQPFDPGPSVPSQFPLVQGTPSSWIRGASQPPYQSMPPMPLPSPAPPFVFEPRPPEQAETLSLPPGLHGQAVPFDAVPKSVTEARVLFTLLSRTLGRHYREKRGIVLRTDLTGVEHMQSVLREHFVVPAIQTAEQASEVRSHGAFLSEILARSFGAEWTDIGPSELGYWQMTTPSGLRVWPFGRILRFILQGHRERDLVSYYLELDARMRR